MKKVLSVLLAGAMVAGMSATAFAADANKTIYNSDGEANKDIYGSYVYENYRDAISIDGVVPGAELYVPLGENMTSAVEGTILNSKTVKYFYKVTKGTDDKYTWKQVDSIDDANYYATTDVADQGTPADALDTNLKDTDLTANMYSVDSLTNTNYFKFDVDKDEGSKYIKKIEVVPDKRLGNLSNRTSYLKITLADSTTTSDLKTDGTITFEAKDASADFRNASGSKKLTATTERWSDDASVKIPYTIWMNNDKAKNDDNIGTGDRVYFDPDKNEDNTLVWGDDRAALFFEGNDDGGKFYARMQTKADSEIYSTYGDPVNADLWFFDFVGNPTVPSTSRATLTLGIPWDEDDDYTPKAEDCFIYEVDADGNLTDVTSKFTYSEDNDGTTEIPGWTIKTRTLGTYIISDTELDTTIVDEVEETEEPAASTEAPAASTGKEIPNTGSSDMVGAAVVAAVVSLAAAGAVAFKKASK